MIDAAHLERLTGAVTEPTLGRWVVAPDALEAMVSSVQARVDEAGALGLDVAALDDRERAVLATLEGVTVDGGHAKPADAVDTLADHPFLDVLAASPFTPPAPEGVDRGELRELVRRGLVVEEDGLFFAASAIEAAARVLAQNVGRQARGGNGGRDPRRTRHKPQVRHPPAVSPRRYGGHPSPRKRPHRRAPESPSSNQFFRIPRSENRLPTCHVAGHPSGMSR